MTSTNYGGEIVYLYQSSGQYKSRKMEKKRHLKILEDAKALRILINEGPLDRHAYHFFPTDFSSIYFSANWEKLDDKQRDQIVPDYSMWPSMSEVLDGLAEYANLIAKQAMTRPLIAERESLDRRPRYFAILLSNYLRRVAGGPMDGCVAAITSVVFNKYFDDKGIKRLLRHSMPQKRKGGA